MSLETGFSCYDDAYLTPPEPEAGGPEPARWDFTGVPMPERLRMIASWLVEDADVDEDDARAVAAVLDEAAAELEG